MAAIGSLVFCTDCGNLLRESTGDETAYINCEVCGTRNRDTAAKSIISKSKPSAFPSALRSKQSAVQTLTSEDADTDAVIQMTCPRCQRTEMRYYTAQLRSADEGTTVFYSCVCGYKDSTNN